MGGIKTTEQFTVNHAHVDWLEEMARKHGLPDRDKALRVVLEYAISEGDEQTIFEEIRCNRC